MSWHRLWRWHIREHTQNSVLNLRSLNKQFFYWIRKIWSVYCVGGVDQSLNVYLVGKLCQKGRIRGNFPKCWILLDWSQKWRIDVKNTRTYWFLCHHSSMVFHPHIVVFCRVDSPTRLYLKLNHVIHCYGANGPLHFHDRLKACMNRVRGRSPVSVWDDLTMYTEGLIGPHSEASPCAGWCLRMRPNQSGLATMPKERHCLA